MAPMLADGTFGGKVALVTGGGSGLGRAFALEFARLGAGVVVAGRRPEPLEETIGLIAEKGGSALAHPTDVRDPDQVDALVAAAVERFGRVDVLVNNAAVLLFENEDALSIPADAYQRTFDTNVFGVVEVCRVFVPEMLRAGYGRVVNVSSGAGQLATMSTYAPAYSMSKTALNAFTWILASTYRGRGVLVNAVDPGWVRTDMGGPSAPRSSQQGADTIVWLATLPDNGPNGGFFRDRRPIEW
jgi:NAD(P)-dependent dehydrogenase (short-subunit alcohol dehydrogenase family)